MKKCGLIIGLVISLLMSAAMPAPVMAAAGVSEDHNTAQKGTFKADGFAMVAYAGNIVSQKFLGSNLVIIKRAGEVIAGDIANCPDWPEFAGTTFEIVEDATTLLNLGKGTFTSTATGTVSVKKDGVLCFTGKYGALMYGGFGFIGNEPVFSKVINNGVMELNGLPGTFKNVEVKGFVSATLTPMIYEGLGTLGGPITIRGSRS
jgi:hypothetical protein